MFSIFNENQAVMKTLSDYIDRKLLLPGNPKYAYTVISKKNPSDVIIISSYPEEWINLYRANNFQLTDPVILNAFRRTSPFAWDENITLMSDRIFSLSRQYNIVNGFTFVLHDQLNNLALLSVITNSRGQGELEERLSAERGAMQMLLIDINEQMYRLARSASSGRQQNELATNKAIFTHRENEILYWASMGKTYAEIAVIAGISVSTVKFHMGNVVSKLGVSNARQAIRLGVELELITPASLAEKPDKCTLTHKEMPL
ncbi:MULTISPECIES: LuxR family transcriptional regulator [unclassified Brenneria]|uniref:LuxR family transcriptional regulator n=1 Tax=unclassified Brenneria TaxID=2634434 RepID=UPI0018F06A37|nr:LuxR family transcriptional regulator [Brenneria sp. L3-3C-1]MBJ7220818.1 LuxR family transcriptional regulator [Brenneria sp. L3-3C-1]MEE3642058.1 LuxR family transcriptional regulator [Brenneria sp. L3_3C_1]